MTSTRRLCIAVLVLATCMAAFAAASSCNIAHCNSCLLGHCTWCEDGYYVSGGQCAACETANCRKCAIVGRCTSCNDGYQLKYVSGGEDGTAVAKYGTCEAKSTAPSACSEAHCTSCIGKTCLYCENGYYVKNGTCASCESAHCAHCELAGRCVHCESGYKLSYASSSDNGVVISRWGTCQANSASFTSASVALASAVVVVMALFAA